MREIKFRAWDGDNYHHWGFNGSTFISPTQTTYKASYEMEHQQYTGLKDSAGKDIYEGDIVYLAGYGDYEVEFPFYQLYQSSWEGDIGEIKGNIYENKDLLNGQANTPTE